MSTATAQVFNLPEREFQQAIAEILGHREYGRVLEAVRFARERDPKNIFLIAIDRQVHRLKELIASDDPEPGERTKLEESLSQLIQRAWADATTRGVVLTLPADLGPAARGVPASAVVPPPSEAAPRARDSGKRAVPGTPGQPSRRSAASMIVAVVSTVLVIGVGITYFVLRKSQPPEQVTVVMKHPAAQEPPPAIAGEVPAAKVNNEPSPIPASASPAATVRERPRPQAARSASGSEKVPKNNVKETPRSIPPSEHRGSSTPSNSVAAGFQPPAAVEPVAETPPVAESAQPFIPVQKEPRVVRLAEPELGDAALRYGKEGEVVARVLIGTDGKAMKVRIVKSTNSFLNKAVAEALLKSEYEPGVMTAGPVQSWLTVPFKFR